MKSTKFSAIQRIERAIVKTVIILDKVEDKAKIDFRLRCCDTCEHNLGTSCALCGCYIDLKAESLTNVNTDTGKIEITHCPDGRWADEDIMKYYQKLNQK